MCYGISGTPPELQSVQKSKGTYWLSHCNSSCLLLKPEVRLSKRLQLLRALLCSFSLKLWRDLRDSTVSGASVQDHWASTVLPPSLFTSVKPQPIQRDSTQPRHISIPDLRSFIWGFWLRYSHWNNRSWFFFHLQWSFTWASTCASHSDINGPT